MIRRSRSRIEPDSHVGLGKDREPVTDTCQIGSLAGRQRIQVVLCGTRSVLIQGAAEHLQPLGVELATSAWRLTSVPLARSARTAWPR